ncbi:putative drug resistance transporter [Luteimicrobium album]|uniref:Drug resistance transporter n=1 Tax=Luteimicrobium album TaxID=1054550 RepID=A0ABQ6I177_9MICO|nr:putative drug resistance transporter [Luteimicrobium album]
MLFLVCAAIFMLMLDTTVVSAALADIRADLDTSIDGLQWVIDGYAIPLAGLLLTFATVGDRYGRRRLFLAGMAVFTAASLALALSGTILQLDVLRAVQGVGATMLFATALPLLSVAFPDPAARMRAIGVYGAVMAGATVAGPVLGGALVTSFGWRSIFLVNVPIGVVILGVATRRLPESPRALGRRADWLGSVLLTGGLVAGVLALTRGNSLGWTSPTLVALAGAALALLVCFVAWQFRAPHPLLDVGMLRKPGFAGTAIVSVGHMATLMAAANFLALFMIGTFGCTPLEMGLRLLPISGAALIAAPVAAALAKRVPLRVSLPVTMGLVTAGMWWLGRLEPGDTWLHFVPGLVVGGLGLGAITALTQAASLTFASQENAGMASATFGTLRQVGMAVGVAGLGAVFSHVARDRATAGVDALPGASGVPTDLREQFADAIGAGAGHEALHDLPSQLHAAAPALARVADAASIDALNAMVNLGAVVGAVATVGATAAFWLGGRAAAGARPGS